METRGLWLDVGRYYGIVAESKQNGAIKMNCPKCNTRMVVDTGMTESCPLCGCSEPLWQPNMSAFPRCPKCGSSFLEVSNGGHFQCPDCGVSG